MEASAIKQHIRVSGGGRGRTPLLRMQSDERLVTLVRRGNHAAFGMLVSRYESRLLAFCRHLLRSREDAEDVLQEVFASSFKAMMADDRPIRVRPWLYRIARNRCLNHLRRISAIGVDSIEDHFSEHGPSTSETVQRREDLWLLVGDIQELPESQRSALLLREMEALSYEQISDVLDKTIPSVKSLLIRARRSLAESAEARSLPCEEALVEVDEVQAGLRERPSRVVRRHMSSCARCAHLQEPEHSLSGLRLWLPLGPLYLLKRLSFSQLIHSAPAGSTATAAGAAAGPTLVGGSSAAGFITAGIGGLAGKAAVGLTAAALGVTGAVVVDTVPTPAKATSSRAAPVAAGAAVPPGAAVPIASAAPTAAAAAVDLGTRQAASRAARGSQPTKTSTSSPTTTGAASPPTPAPADPAAAAVVGGPHTQVVATTLPGAPAHVDATGATANPAAPSGPGIAGSSGGVAPTGTLPSGTPPPASSPDGDGTSATGTATTTGAGTTAGGGTSPDAGTATGTGATTTTGSATTTGTGTATATGAGTATATGAGTTTTTSIGAPASTAGATTPTGTIPPAGLAGF
jgi:RNA polymerase sigma factor (sigma-70 family)